MDLSLRGAFYYLVDTGVAGKILIVTPEAIPLHQGVIELTSVEAVSVAMSGAQIVINSGCELQAAINQFKSH